MLLIFIHLSRRHQRVSHLDWRAVINTDDEDVSGRCRGNQVGQRILNLYQRLEI